MAYIAKPKRKNHTITFKRAERRKYYNNTAYQHGRKWYLMQHMWCERCMEKGEYVPSHDLHHIVSPFDGQKTEQQKMDLLLDENNWIALCRNCHNAIHTEQERNKRR